MTRNGIEYDLPNSPYKVEIGDYIFYFSSELYCRKFHENILIKRLDFDMRLKKMTGINISCFKMFLIYLYSKIEKRGFYIYNKLTAEYYEKESEILID